MINVENEIYEIIKNTKKNDLVKITPGTKLSDGRNAAETFAIFRILQKQGCTFGNKKLAVFMKNYMEKEEEIKFFKKVAELKKFMDENSLTCLSKNSKFNLFFDAELGTSDYFSFFASIKSASKRSQYPEAWLRKADMILELDKKEEAKKELQEMNSKILYGKRVAWIKNELDRGNDSFCRSYSEDRFPEELGGIVIYPVYTKAVREGLIIKTNDSCVEKGKPLSKRAKMQIE